MARLLGADAVIIGRLSYYTIIKELHRAADEGAVYLAMNRSGERSVVKSIRGHWRLRNEADVLRRYQSPFLRPLIDEIHEPADPPSIVLRYLDSDCLTESNKKRFSRPEIKQVARSVLEALRVLHRDGMVHTDVKLDNVFVNYDGDGGERRFSEVQLGDCGGVVSQESSFAKDGHLIGAGFTRSPEATFQLSWGTATDIWSFGTAMLSLILGGGYHLFNPQVEGIRPEDDAYEFTVLKRMYKFFGRFPESYNDFNDPATTTIIDFIHREGPPAKPFARAGPKELPPADKEFILKIMKLDPRDRPTAEQLLADPWFTEESPDTREPLPGEVGPLGEANCSPPKVISGAKPASRLVSLLSATHQGTADTVSSANAARMASVVGDC